MKLAATLLTVCSLAAAADAPPRPKITGVAHIALFVHDMDKARSFYKDFLGLGEPYLLNKPDGGLAMTFIKVNERQYIELFPKPRWARIASITSRSRLTTWRRCARTLARRV